MEALSADTIPQGAQWQYEPKWDGFRCVAFRDGKNIFLQSKAGQPLGRYFPEITGSLGALAPERFVLDGEIVIAIGDTLSFNDLLMRIHPAESRIRKLSALHPATYVLFDLLLDENGPLLMQPLAKRRQALEQFARNYLQHQERLRLSPKTDRFQEAMRWFKKMAGGLDGVIAKRLDAPYERGERSGAVQKIKNLRTADCVVGGFRYAQKKQDGARVVGSLLLGLYNDRGLLDHVGFTSAISRGERAALTRKLEKLVEPPGFTGSAPGGPSRWSTKRSMEWSPLKPSLVVEVRYDHFSGGRFRHGTQLVRWRPDKAPRQCRASQVVHESKSPLSLLDAR